MNAKHAIITGAANGIGLGVATYFIEHGYEVSLIDIRHAFRSCLPKPDFQSKIL